MKKIKIILILFIFTIIVLILGSIILPKYIYTLDKVSYMLNSATIPKNVYIHEYFYISDCTTYMDIYVKDNTEYYYQKTISNNPNIDDYNIDMIGIYEGTKDITISNTDKKISVHNIENNSSILKNPYKNSFFISVEQHGLYEHLGIYKYCGKGKVNGKKCIKVSMTDNYEDKINIDYYYIDLETNLILKEESYSGYDIKQLELNRINIYEYYFNSVTDSDIPEFDIKNYPDYEYIEW